MFHEMPLKLYFLKCFERKVSQCILALSVVLKFLHMSIFRSSCPEVFLRKGVLKISSKFTGEHPCWSVISIKLHAALLKSHFGMGVLL